MSDRPSIDGAEPNPVAPDSTLPPSSDIEDDSGDKALSDPRELLLAKLGHDRDAGESIDRFLVGVRAFEKGDNRFARNAFRDLLKVDLSDELRAETRAMLARIEPDPLALVVALVCALGLVLVWFLAVRA